MSSFKKLALYSHISSGNRGCEATAWSTCKMLGFDKESTFVFSNDVKDEIDCFTDRYSTIVPITKVEGARPITSIIPRALKKFNIDVDATSKYLYKKHLELIDADTIALSTGGDLYCYDNTNHWLDYLNREALKKSATTVLWACSIDKDRLTNKLIKDLKKYSHIMARESITYQNLLDSGIKENVSLYPDPAFILEKQPIDMSLWKNNGDLIGINISNRTNGGFETNSVFFRNTVELINHVIKNTKMNILLIPHVYWQNENDLILLKKLKEIFKESERVFLADAKMNCRQLKYIISQCRFFLGARTHSVIAAYSSGVPTLALGYSIKSVGLARDIFGDEKDMVLSSKNISGEKEMIKAFEKIRANEVCLKEKLQKKIPEYVEELKKEAEYIQSIAR